MTQRLTVCSRRIFTQQHTNSTAVDDKLFRKRAEAIRDILLERYEIPASKIRIIASEKDIKPIGDYIELIVND